MTLGTLLTLVLGTALLAGCSNNNRNAEVQKKLDDLQKQVEEQKKELEAARLAASPAAPDPAPAAQAVKPGSKAPAKASGTAAKSPSNASSAQQSELAAAKGAIEQTRQETAKNSEAISANSQKIATAEQNIEKNRAGVEEAKRMAAPAPTHTLTAGTPLVVRTTGKLSTKTNASGSSFEATLEQPIEVDGYLVAPRGATVEGVVTQADDGGRVKGRPSITVALRRITMADGRTLAIRTSSVTEVSEGSVAKDATKVAIASGIGAAIGAIAGGGKGAAIGAGVGAGGGTAGILLTKGKPAEIAAETVLRFSLTADAKFQELKK